MLIGYARTSTLDQLAGLEAQIRDLYASGCKQVFQEQISSVKEHRPMLDTALNSLNGGDVLVVTKPDRLARSTQDLLRIVESLEKKGVGLIVLSMGGERLDTRNPTSKLILTILAGVATWEREIMLDRQREGIIKGQQAGKYNGRHPTVSTTNRESVLRMQKEGASGHAIARTLGVSKRTIYRMISATKPAEMAGLQAITQS